MRVTVAAVVCGYRRREFIAEAVASALAQTDHPDEVLVSADFDASSLDGMPEASGLIHRRVGECSMGHQYADALRSVNSDVVCFLDDDDWWRPDKIAVVRRAFTDTPRLAMLQHRIEYCGPVAEEWSRVHPQPTDHEFDPLAPGATREQPWLSRRSAYGNLSSLSFRRSSLDRALNDGIFEEVQAQPDLALPVFSMAAGGLHRFIGDVLSDYRLHDSTCRKVSGNFYQRNPEDARKAVLTEAAVLEYLTRIGLGNALPGRLMAATLLWERAKIARRGPAGRNGWSLADAWRTALSGLERLQPYVVRDALLALLGGSA